MDKKLRSGMNILDHISESVDTIFRVKNSLIRIRNLFEPGSRMEKIQIREKHPGSATIISPFIKSRKIS
jgi:hypothetical protein